MPGFHAPSRIQDVLNRCPDMTRQEICHFAFRGNQCWRVIDDILEDLQYRRQLTVRLAQRGSETVRLYRLRNAS